MKFTKEYLALWAKSPPKDFAGKSHPVIAHLLDVAASSWAILEREPLSTQNLYAQDLGLPRAEALPWIYALVGLHDLGKISPAFQQKWLPGLETLFATEPKFKWSTEKRPEAPPKDAPHSVISQRVLPDLLEPKGFPRDVSLSIADAVGCHHGFRANDSSVKERERGLGVWDDARAEVFEAILQIVGVTNPPTVTEFGAAAFMRLAGLTSFADWVGSSFYPELTFEGFEHDLLGYYEASKKLAQKRLDEFGWTKRDILVEQELPLEQVFDYLVRKDGIPFIPRELQIKVKETLEHVSEPTLLLIEAAMGEGKTEAAFYAHLRLQAQLGHRGLYIALPTMATGNAMFERTATFLNEHAGNRIIPLDLQLLHGATQLNTQYQKLRNAANLEGKPQIQPNIPEDQQNTEEHLEHIIAREFFSRKGRALLSEYGVGTVDQALLSVLNIKHQFVRLWGLGNRVVVIDEVHAYDTYTSSLICTLVQWLRALGSSVIIMSATLPKESRIALLEAYGANEIEDTNHYPRMFKVSGGQTELVKLTGESTRAKPLNLEPIASDLSQIATLLEEKLAAGGCAVCIVNTVDRAQKLYQMLESKGFDRHLFHARFPAEDRSRLEQEVLAKFGKKATLENGSRPEKSVLVATQVVEQSLDLDFDLMISDLAPIDLLLQRAGRLWRHPRANRPIETPTLYIAGLRFEGELPDLSSEFWDKIYQPFVLYKTWEQLRGESTVKLPQDIDPWVQKVYDRQDVALELSQVALEQIANDQKQWEADQLVDRKDGDNAVISHSSRRTGELLLRNVDAVREEDDKASQKPTALTRKGEASVMVIPLYKLGGKYFLDAAGQRLYDLKMPLEVFGRAVRLSRVGVIGNPKKKIASALERYNHAQGIDKIFKAWEKDALLRNCVPLVLDTAGKLQLPKVAIELHPDLGVVYVS
jgi:CRISPR-associated endonuclease/helicase Cas3